MEEGELVLDDTKGRMLPLWVGLLRWDIAENAVGIISAGTGIDFSAIVEYK